jgi:DNA repair photolyase
MTKPRTGTREWASKSVNIQMGCEHDCRYCYARANALRFGRITSPEDWPVTRLNEEAVRKNRGKCRGRIMFPTAHDITEKNIGNCLSVLIKLLRAGNKVLIATKPGPAMDALYQYLFHYREQVLFRFSITGFDARLLRYWEPNAPSYDDRRHQLRRAFQAGYATSVSIEPALAPEQVPRMVRELEDDVTDTIWIGTMRHIRRRVRIETETDRRMVEAMEAAQSEENILALHAALKDHPKIRWKDSIRAVLEAKTTRRNG